MISLGLWNAAEPLRAFPTDLVCYEYELVGSSNERTEESTEAEKARLQDGLTDSDSYYHCIPYTAKG